MAQSATTIQGYLPQKIWIFNLFVFIFLIWWATWEFRSVDWTFPQYAYLLIAVTIDGNVLSKEPIWHSGRFGHAVLPAASVWGYFAVSRKAHIAVASITLLALFATTVARFWLPR